MYWFYSRVFLLFILYVKTFSRKKSERTILICITFWYQIVSSWHLSDTFFDFLDNFLNVIRNNPKITTTKKPVKLLTYLF